jgi:hypothetical protein
MAPRGLKTLIKSTAPGRLVGSGRFKGFQATNQKQLVGQKLRGLTKLLYKKIFSNGTLPLIARKAEARPGGHWKGKKGGQLRGTKVDAQISRIINSGAASQKKLYNLTKLVFAALKEKGLEPIVAQRVVLSQNKRVATAADFICYNPAENSIVIVELKTGYDHGRQAAAETSSGRQCKMRTPLASAHDCNLYRHMAQLAVTRELFMCEKDTIKKLAQLGINEVVGLLMYATDSGIELFELTDWWTKKGPKILRTL